MNEKEIREAIAKQEEYIKRRGSCTFPGEDRPRVGLPHSWETFSTVPGGPTYQACFRCRVTRTAEDYQIKLGSDE